MLQKTKLPYTRLFAFLLAVFVAIGALFSSVKPVHAADGTIDFHAGPSIAYGDYFTSRMTFDGSNTAYCVEPLKRTPPSGTYSYDLLEKTSPLRKALYYLNGGYGYDTVTKEKYFQGWSDDNAYVIGHLAVAYIYAGNTGDTGAFHGAPQSFIDKTLEVVQGISELPAPPENFRAFLVPGNGNQTFAGSWYQVPNGWIELQKSSANPSISDGNGNYTLEGAKYGIYKGDKLIQTLTTDKNGYAKSKELEEGSYTVKEISAPAGFIVDATAHDVNVKPEETSTVKSSDIPQNNPISLILQKLDLETGEGKPQGNSSLANAEFTIKFYTELSDTDPATSGKKPVRTWVMKTNASGEMHFTKDYFVSGDEFYYASDKKTVCLPIGTVTIQETKAPKNYFLNETVFVQKITGSEDARVAYTDNYKIHCNAGNPITQSFPSRFLRALSISGFTGHETAHLRYSDFTSLNLYLTKLEQGIFYPEPPEINYPEYQRNLDVITEAMEEKDRAVCLTLSRCAAQINNILEDIYIEARMCEDCPGTFKQGIQMNHFRMTELIPDIHDQIAQGYQPFSIMSNLLLSYCRTGNINNRTDYSGEYMDTLMDCTEYIDEALNAPEGKARMAASNHLAVICWKYIEPLVDKMREELEKQDEESAANDLEKILGNELTGASPLPIGKNGGIPKNLGGPSNGSAPGVDLSPKGRQELMEAAKKVFQEEGGRIELAKTTSIMDGNNPGITFENQYSGSGYEHAASDLARILTDVATGLAEEKYEQELTEELQKTADEINYGNAHAGIHVTVHRMNTVSDFLIREYSQIATPLLRASKRLQNSILPLLKDEAEGGKQKNLMFGKRLDMRVLHREDGTIFTRTRLPNDEQRLAVGLLVDESGSMDWGDRITHARKTAIVLYDFCISLGIPITIYGHSTGYDDVDLYSYAEFDSLDASDRYRLMDMSARGGNRDGAALRFVAEHLAKRPETRKLLIIISDGQPAAGGYSGTAAEADLRGIKKEFQKRGVITFAAAIGDDKENIRRIYKDGFLDITRLGDLPKNMTQLVKQYLK